MNWMNGNIVDGPNVRYAADFFVSMAFEGVGFAE
jgi:hypothetical protein